MGYGGSIEVLVALDAEGRVVKVRLGRHNETPEYVYDIDEWMAGLEGKAAAGLTYGDPDEPDGVDAYSGATVTGIVVVDLVRAVGERLRPGRDGGGQESAETGIEGTEGAGTGPVTRGRGPRSRSWTWLFMLLIYAAGAGLYFHGGRRLRTIYLLAVVVLAGFMWNHQLAFDSLVSLVSGNPPAWSNLAVWVMMAGLVITAILAGALFCGYLCPFGALTDLVSRFGLKWRVGPRLDRLLRNIKYVLAVLLLSAALLVPARHLFAFDPLLYSFKLRFDMAGGLTLLVIVAASLLWYRPWCRYLCPLGAAATVLERHGLLNRIAPNRRTGNCHLGVTAGADWDCIRCNRCVKMSPPAAHRQPGTASGPLLIAVLLLLGGLGTWRVVESADRAVGKSPIPSAAVTVPAGSAGRPADARTEPAETPSADAAVQLPESSLPQEPEGPKLRRKDNEQYEYQRAVDLQRIRQLIDDGQLSGREAEFYLPVEE